MKTTGKKTLGERINALLTRMIRFVTYDIWRITENEVSGLKELYINIIKTIILAVRGFQSENLQTKASASPTAPCYPSCLSWRFCWG